MQTLFVSAPDGVRIAYDVHGAGPAVLLLHGLGPDRQIWHQHGWVKRLESICTVITIDLRGHGESDKPVIPQAYACAPYLSDLVAVADACGSDQFAVVGWSFGGTIGLQAAATSARLSRAVIAGTSFGRIFTEEAFRPIIERWEPIVTALGEGQALERLGLPPEQYDFARQTNLAARLALWKGLLTWPIVEPGDVGCPALIYTGTADHALAQLTPQREALHAAGIPLHIFDGLDHVQLVSAIDTVMPIVLPFLRPAVSGVGIGGA